MHKLTFGNQGIQVLTTDAVREALILLVSLLVLLHGILAYF